MSKHGRLIGLLHIAATDLDFTKFMVENSNCLRLDIAEGCTAGYCLGEEEAAAVHSAVAENKKASTEYLTYFLERLAKHFKDDGVAAAVSTATSKKAMKKKKLIALLRAVPDVNDARSVQLLKACSKEFASLAQQYMTTEFQPIATLKHGKAHPVVVRCEDKADGGCVRARVVHLLESSAKLFQLQWQVVVDLDWSRGGSMSAKNIGIYITKMGFKHKDGIAGEQAEAVAAVMVKHKVPRAASVRKSRRPSSARKDSIPPVPRSSSPVTTEDGADSTAAESTAASDLSAFPSDDDVLEDITEEGESDEESDDEQDTLSIGHAGSFRVNRLSRFLPSDDTNKGTLAAAMEAALAETQSKAADPARSSSGSEASTPSPGKSGSKVISRSSKSMLRPMSASKFNVGIQSMMMSPSCTVSLARPAEPGEAVPTPEMEVSDAPKTTNTYSAPLLLPGEIVVQDNIINDVKHKYGENIIGRHDKTEASRGKKHKWFGANRLKGGASKPKKKQSKSVLGRIIVTNFQLIFVPVATGPELCFVEEQPKRKSGSGPTRAPGFTSPMAKYMGARRAKASSMFLRSNHRSSGSEEVAPVQDDSKLQRESDPNPPVAAKSDGWQQGKTDEEEPQPAAAAPKPPGVHNVEEHVYIPFLDIYRVDVVNKHKVGGSKTVEIACKDFRTLYFSFSNATMAVSDFVSRMMVYFPTKELDMFAFRFADNRQKLSQGGTVDGWKHFNQRRELERILCKDPAWRITDSNLDYGLCDTYMKVLAVPATVTDEQLHKVKEFRSRARLPALSWRHPETKASLTRCSQPKVGMTGARCVEDEQLLWDIMLVNQDRQAASAKKATVLPLYLMDARPRANAMANHAVGAGFEDTSRYKNAKLRFLNIPNIHVMRDALRKLHELCLPHSSAGGGGFLSALESTHWLEYIHLLIVSAVRICNLMNAGINVLIHCSDGWDRTSQLSALVMLLMDPYYRTLDGFIVLIEKEWLGYGHKFRDRCGHIHPWTESETSPIFLQFIDAVWQITEQFPGEFEFNTRFLIMLLDQINSGQYGTFLCNSVKEREDLKLAEQTVSLWTHVIENYRFYTHAHFYGYQFASTVKAQRATCTCSYLRPSTEMKAIKFWSDYYLRFDRSVPSGVLLREADLWAWAHVAHLEKATKEFAEYKAGVDALKCLHSGELAKSQALVDSTLLELHTLKAAATPEGGEKSSNVELNYEKLVSQRLRADLADAKAEIARLQEELEKRSAPPPMPDA